MDDFNITILHNGTEANYNKSWFAELSLYELIKEFDIVRERFAWLNNHVDRGYELWNDSMISMEHHPGVECDVDDYKDIITAFKQIHGIVIKETLKDDDDKTRNFWWSYHNPSSGFAKFLNSASDYN